MVLLDAIIRASRIRRISPVQKVLPVDVETTDASTPCVAASLNAGFSEGVFAYASG